MTDQASNDVDTIENICHRMHSPSMMKCFFPWMSLNVFFTLCFRHVYRQVLWCKHYSVIIMKFIECVAMMSVVMLAGCQKDLVHHVLTSHNPQSTAGLPTNKSSVSSAVSQSQIMHHSVHRIQLGAPLTIGSGFTCMALTNNELNILEATVIENIKPSCTSSGYLLDQRFRGGSTYFFINVDDPVPMIHPKNMTAIVAGLPVAVKETDHECQIIIDFLPEKPIKEKIVGRRFSLFLSNYAVTARDPFLCGKAKSLVNYLVPHILG